MNKTAVQSMEYFEIADGDRRYLGGMQDWYRTRWQRLSGCGPCAVATVLLYLDRREGAPMPDPLSRRDFLLRMEEVWRYVTPTLRGIPEAALLAAGAERYFQAHGSNLRAEILDVPEKRERRPGLGKIAAFLRESLAADSPAAFLNLNRGREPALDSWHWVTVTGLEEDGSGGAFLNFLDGGKALRADLSLWLSTTTLGGGFVRFLAGE